MTLLAIDPGTTRSAWVNVVGDVLLGFGILPNEQLLIWLRVIGHPVEGGIDQVVIEKVESYGMAVGADVFETVYWSGRFTEAAEPLPVDRIGRKAVKLHLCGNTRAKDSNIRQALIDRYGGVEGKRAAIGLKASPGPLYGLSKDVWAALAVACVWADQQADR
ncbi:MAG: hypothetical protein ACC726_11495 [Chloroflexota bacterium]